MRMSRLKGSADMLEDRRRRALTLWDKGLSLNEVGRRIQCAASSVLRWLRARRRGGPDALRVRFSPGRPWKLDARQRRRLVKLLVKGAQEHGYRTQLWTTARIAELIRREFGVHYHCDHVGRLMHSLNWSPQKPETRAIERDEEAIERWKRKDWPRVKKTPRGWAPTQFLLMNRAFYWLRWWSGLGRPKAALPSSVIAKGAGIRSPSFRESRSAPNDSG